jgi:hypothetical protein
VHPALKVHATFGFTVRGRREGAKSIKLMVFGCTLGWGSLWLALSSASKLVGESTFVEFRDRLQNFFGGDVNLEMKFPNVQFSALANRLPEFQRIMLWFKEQAAIARGEPQLPIEGAQ